MLCISLGFSFCCQYCADAVHFKVEITFSCRVADEELNATVLPYRTVILKCDSLYVVLIYFKKHCEHLV